MKLFHKTNFLLLAIIILSAFFRLVNLGSIPIGFNDDEAAFGYNAYSVLKTGRDEWGELLPFPVFESFGDWKLVGYLYLTVIAQFFFGVNEFATRLPSAVFGIIAVLATYLLTKKLFDRKAALLSSFLLAINPWHIIASRNAFESDILIFYISISTYFFLTGLKHKKYLVLAFVGYVSCFYIYRSAWLFVPLFVLNLIITCWNHLRKIKILLIKILIASFVFLLPIISVAVNFKGQSRFFQESIISGVTKSGIINDVNERRGVCQQLFSGLICTSIYNKYSFFFSTFLNNYFSNLSPETYFIRGNPGGYQTFSNRGFFYTFELPLLIAGLIFLIKKNHPAVKVLIAWILIAPIGPAITGIGNPGRLNILMPSTQIIAAYGLLSLLGIFKNIQVKKLLIYIFAFITFVSMVRFIADLFVYYPWVSGRFQRYGYKQLFDWLQIQQANYSQIAISRKSDDAKQYIHYLFYEKIDPKKFHDPKFTTKYRGGDIWQVVEKIGKFQFYPSVPRLNDLSPKTLLAVGEKEVDFPVSPIYVINYDNSDRAFEVYDVDEVREKLKE